MKTHRADMVSLIMVLAVSAAAVWFYGRLPDPVPTHWDLSGAANGFMAKPWGVLIYPGMLVAVWLLFKLIPVISPHGFRVDAFIGVVEILQVTVLCCLSLISIGAYLAAMGKADINSIVPLTIGILFIILGNYLGKMRRNFFLGIRTPWTLASAEVWNRTHRVGGYVFVAAGLLAVLGALGGAPSWLMMGPLIAAGLIPVFYSLWLYRRLEGLGPDD